MVVFVSDYIKLGLRVSTLSTRFYTTFLKMKVFLL